MFLIMPLMVSVNDIVNIIDKVTRRLIYVIGYSFSDKITRVVPALLADRENSKPIKPLIIKVEIIKVSMPGS